MKQRFTFAVILAMAVIPAAQAQSLVPRVNLVEVEWSLLEDGIAPVAATFGYFNGSAVERTIPIGTQNFFSPGAINRGQPTQFLPGVHDNIVTALHNPGAGDLFWRLDGVVVGAGASDSISYVRRVSSGVDYSSALLGRPEGWFADTYTHTAASPAAVTGRLVVQRHGSLVMAGGTFTHAQVETRPTGTIRLEDGVLAATESLTNAGLLRLDSGALNTTELINAPGGHIQVMEGNHHLPLAASAGRISMEGGVVTVDSLSQSGNLDLFGGSFTVGGSLLLEDGANLRLDGGLLEVGSLVNAGATIAFDGGTLRIGGGDLVAGPGGALGVSPVISRGSQVELAGGQALVDMETSLDIVSGAQLITQGGSNAGITRIVGATLLSESGVFVNETGGNLTAVQATLDFREQGLQNLGDLIMVNSTLHGQVQSPGGTSVVIGGQAIYEGLFSGAADFAGLGAAVFNGGYSSGDSPALVTHEGDVLFGADNVLTLALAGLVRGDQYDALDIGGSLVLGGQLFVDLLDDFQPPPGASFQLFTLSDSDNLSGMFTQVFLPDLDGGLAWDSSQLYAFGRLSVISESDTYTVGGQVTGLAGSGLVLQNNGGDDLIIQANGAFEFETPLPNNAPYIVTIRNQPADPFQPCTVSGGEGVIEASDVTGVAVTCADNVDVIFSDRYER